MFALYAAKFYRNDIQGIRAISALLIMIYHIWFNRVSGGVDVFFVISGFLITTTLLRGLASSGRVRPVHFWARICRRIFPSAFTVLIATLVLSVFFVPVPLWKYSVNEFIASAAQIENLELLRMGADYLSREAPPSQFQQFWALSIQMQFYLLLPLIVMLLAYIARRVGSLRPLVWGITGIIAVSLIFSIVLTHLEPNEAYFHPLTRLWEFMAGALVAIIYPKLSALGRASSSRLWNILAIAAVVVLATLGLTLGGTVNFPGWVALIPVLCAVILIVAGNASSEPTAVTRGLSHPALVYFGSFSFTIYLWHWPLLVFAHHQFQTTQLNLIQGLGVIVLAVALAFVTTRFIEGPLTRRPIKKARLTLPAHIAVVVVIVLFGLFLRQSIVVMATTQTGNIENAGSTSGLAIQDQTEIPLEKYVTIDLDRPNGISCLTVDCTGGDRDGDKLIVMAGESHSAQWFDIVNRLGKDEGYRVITRLGDDDLAGIAATTGADVIFMNSTRTATGTAPEEAYLDDTTAWQKLSDQGVAIVGVRDNPRFSTFQNACVWQNQNVASECAINQDELLSDTDPAQEIADLIENFHAVDLTQFFCVDGICPAVHDDLMIFYDKHHISQSYSNYIEDAVVREIKTQAAGAFS